MQKTWPDEPQRFREEDIDTFLLWCVKQNSSDVTIQSDRPVYNEIHGELYPGTFRALDASDMSVFSNKNFTVLRHKHDWLLPEILMYPMKSGRIVIRAFAFV